MLGTLVNTATIVIGSAVGALARRGLGKRYQEILYAAMGLAAVGIGVNAIVTSMSQSIYPVLFIASLAIGGVLGTAIDIDGRFSRFVSKRSKDGEGLAQGLSTAIMIFCIGALSILGPINSALYGDETYLLTNATLDLVTSMVLPHHSALVSRSLPSCSFAGRVPSGCSRVFSRRFWTAASWSRSRSSAVS